MLCADGSHRKNSQPANRERPCSSFPNALPGTHASGSYSIHECKSLWLHNNIHLCRIRTKCTSSDVFTVCVWMPLPSVRGLSDRLHGRSWLQCWYIGFDVPTFDARRGHGGNNSKLLFLYSFGQMKGSFW